MKVKKIELTSKDLLILLEGANTVSAVYVDKASNYGNVYSSDAGKHTYVPSFRYLNGVLKIDVPKISLTFFTITIFSGNEVLVTMYLNQFSLFKAKSKYLQIFEGCCYNPNHNLICTGCGEKTKRSNMIIYMLRLNLFQGCYINNNVKMAVKYYIDACRIYDMDKIYFEFLDFNKYYNGVSGNLELLFTTLNNWIKGNAANCEKKVLESLLIADLYSLIFGGLEVANTPEEDESIEKDDMYYGYLDQADIAEWDQMVELTHDFSLLNVEDINKGISNHTVTKAILSNKLFNLNIPSGQGCMFVLIPVNSSKRAMKWNGINEWVQFTTTDSQTVATLSEYGIVSNSENTINIDGVVYKIYGENYLVDGETTIKIS